VTYFPTYLPIYETYFPQNWLPPCNQIWTPQLNNSRHPVDGALVGASSLWPLCVSPEPKPSGRKSSGLLTRSHLDQNPFTEYRIFFSFPWLIKWRAWLNLTTQLIPWSWAHSMELMHPWSSCKLGRKSLD